jgi:hypothetical protein
MLRILRLLPTIIGSTVMFGAQVGPNDAERNLCAWVKMPFPNLPAAERCLHGLNTAYISIIALIAIIGGLVWFVWPWAAPRLRKADFEDRAKATQPATKKASIVMGSGEPFQAVEPAGVNRRRVVRVELQNETDVEISNGRLSVANLDPPSSGVTECELRRDITIGPRSHCFVEVAYFDIGSSQARPGSSIRLAVPMIGGFLGEAYAFANLPLQESTFYLRFSRFAEVYDEAFCALYVDSGHCLRFENRGASSGRSPLARLPNETGRACDMAIDDAVHPRSG